VVLWFVLMIDCSDAQHPGRYRRSVGLLFEVFQIGRPAGMSSLMPGSIDTRGVSNRSAHSAELIRLMASSTRGRSPGPRTG
jgi:hypothetical protein